MMKLLGRLRIKLNRELQKLKVHQALDSPCLQVPSSVLNQVSLPLARDNTTRGSSQDSNNNRDRLSSSMSLLKAVPQALCLAKNMTRCTPSLPTNRMVELNKTMMTIMTMIPTSSATSSILLLLKKLSRHSQSKPSATTALILQNNSHNLLKRLNSNRSRLLQCRWQHLRRCPSPLPAPQHQCCLVMRPRSQHTASQEAARTHSSTRTNNCKKMRLNTRLWAPRSRSLVAVLTL
mmetsp:Transcript_4956/g.6058  ORF Transcript_4956/g.6058 Transcript_4956/m.6058 type:complete len:234 (+) Transcript_4956:104-805(+)